MSRVAGIAKKAAIKKARYKSPRTAGALYTHAFTEQRTKVIKLAMKITLVAAMCATASDNASLIFVFMFKILLIKTL